MNRPNEQEQTRVEQVLRQTLQEDVVMNDRSGNWWSTAVSEATRQPRRGFLGRGWSRGRALPALAMSFALVLVLGGGMVLASAMGLFGGTTPGNDPGLLASDQTGPGMSAMCIEVYSPETIVHRTFAFDGTVRNIEIKDVPGGELDGGFQEYWVTFDVHRWYAGGEGDEASVWMNSRWIVESDTIGPENEPFGLGSRLLVSGEPRDGATGDPLAWTACGFTKVHTPELADEWAGAFGA